MQEWCAYFQASTDSILMTYFFQGKSCKVWDENMLLEGHWAVNNFLLHVVLLCTYLYIFWGCREVLFQLLLRTIKLMPFTSNSTGSAIIVWFHDTWHSRTISCCDSSNLVKFIYRPAHMMYVTRYRRRLHPVLRSQNSCLELGVRGKRHGYMISLWSWTRRRVQVHWVLFTRHSFTVSIPNHGLRG